jgi:hypothetical protein
MDEGLVAVLQPCTFWSYELSAISYQLPAMSVGLVLTADR